MNPPDPAPEVGPFAAPWEANAFALAVALSGRGVFSWSEWAATLSLELGRAPGRPYYESWLAALQAITVAKGVAGTDEIEALDAAWRRAAEATPHGQPILLDNDPQRAATIRT